MAAGAVSGERGAVVCAGLHHVRRHHQAQLPNAQRHRSEDPSAAVQLLRQDHHRRGAQPHHKRCGHHRPEPEPEPDPDRDQRHIGHRNLDHDVHDQLAADAGGAVHPAAVRIRGELRDQVITEFQTGDIPVFLISLKAGGVGLNLTAADTVIHYDPWWNPAAEDQASDRAWRIGQKKPVFVYKLITNQSIEEKILALQKNKANLTQSILSIDHENEVKLSENDVMSLLD